MGPIRRLASGILVLALVFGAWVIMPDKVEGIAQGAAGSSAPLAQKVSQADPSSVLNWLKGLVNSSQERIAAQGADTSAASPADYEFLENADGSPLRWNPCEPIHYVVNGNEALPGALQDVQSALSTLSGATGIEFVYDGSTDLIPSKNWYQTSWEGSSYAPLIIAWANSDETDMIESVTDSGRTVTNPATINGVARYVTGAVVLNSAQNNLYTPGMGSGMTRGTLLLHELGHAVGLAHAADESETMYPQIGSFSTGSYSASDLAGLSLLGAQQGCIA